jgi:hypothetical protein
MSQSVERIHLAAFALSFVSFVAEACPHIDYRSIVSDAADIPTPAVCAASVALYADELASIRELDRTLCNLPAVCSSAEVDRWLSTSVSCDLAERLFVPRDSVRWVVEYRDMPLVEFDAFGCSLGSVGTRRVLANCPFDTSALVNGQRWTIEAVQQSA